LPGEIGHVTAGRHCEGRDATLHCPYKMAAATIVESTTSITSPPSIHVKTTLEPSHLNVSGVEKPWFWLN